jgi:DNA-binding LacI/PurR family transcriptional regulator
MSQPVTKPATIYDVARAAGVSHQSVSRHLRGLEVRPSTREKVEAALVKLDYRTNVTARNLRRGRTGMIALSIPSLDQPYFAELAQSVIHAARAHDLSVFVETTELDRDRELATLSQLSGDVVDGVIFAPSVLDQSDLEAVRVGIPLVLIGDRILSSGFDHVTMANRAAAETAVQHLLASGRRRIVALGVEPRSDNGAATPRLAGYLDAHLAAGVTADPQLAVGGSAWTRSEGATVMQSLIDTDRPFDAVFAFNDALALGALRALQSSGCRVPHDVAVVGFDDTQDARFSTPSLSSISAGREELARSAVEMLVERIAGADTPPRDIYVSFHLERRESTASPSDR